MLDGRARDVGDGGSDGVGDLLELVRPVGVVADDVDGHRMDLSGRDCFGAVATTGSPIAGAGTIN